MTMNPVSSAATQICVTILNKIGGGDRMGDTSECGNNIFHAFALTLRGSRMARIYRKHFQIGLGFSTDSVTNQLPLWKRKCGV